MTIRLGTPTLPTNPPDDGIPSELHPDLEDLDKIVSDVEGTLRTVMCCLVNCDHKRRVADYILSLKEASDNLPCDVPKGIDLGQYIMYLSLWAERAGYVLAALIVSPIVADIRPLWGEEATDELVTWIRGRMGEVSDRLWEEQAADRGDE